MSLISLVEIKYTNEYFSLTDLHFYDLISVFLYLLELLTSFVAMATDIWPGNKGIKISQTLVIRSSAMGVERLQLLVQFCNLSGLLPFRMILDEETRRFKRFEGHWRHLANWWCSFITAIKVAVLVASIYFAAVSFLAGEKQSLAYQLVYLLYCSNYAILLLLSPSLFLFRIRHLESAFESLHRIDRMIEAAVKSSCTIRRRTFIGILIIVIDVCHFKNGLSITYWLTTRVFICLAPYCKHHLCVSVHTNRK